MTGSGVVLTAVQRRAWLIEQTAPGAGFQHLAVGARLRGPLDMAALLRSLRSVMARHEPLRVALAADGAADEARVLPVAAAELAAALDLPEVDAGGADADAAVDRLLRAPFDLAVGPPLRAALLRHGAQDAELLLVGHAVAVDMRSLELVVSELAACYGACATGAEPALPAAVPYRAVAAARRERLAGPDGERQRAFWSAELTGLSDPVPLPWARARPETPSFRTDVVELTLPALPALAALARAEGVDLATLVATAWVVLVHRWARVEEVVLGVPAARPGDAGTVVGPVEDVLTLRVRMGYDPSWRAAVRAVRAGLAQVQAAADVPFGEQVALAAPPRQFGVHPLWTVFARRVDPPPAPVTAAGLEFSLQRWDVGRSSHDIELETVEGPEPRVVLRYRTDLLDPDRATELAGRLAALLGQLAGQPDEHLSNLPLLQPGEGDRIVRDWNRTRTDYPRDTPVHVLFEQWADRAPDAPALHWEDRSLTYGDLAAQANQLAHHLLGLGVHPQSRVGLYFGYSCDWVVGALATLKAGAAYVPLDPAYPADRLATMCVDAGVEVLLMPAEADRDGLFPGVRRVHPDADAALVAAEQTVRPAVAVDPEDLAYVMFTSGSTGRPKGIGVTHRNVVRTVRETPYLQVKPSDSVGQGSNISFDAATLETWGALLNGARLVGLRKEDLLDPRRLRGQLVAHGIDVFFLPAALMKQLVVEAPDTFSSLRYFFSGGEQADFHTLRRIVAHGAPEHLINPYGPTETTVFAAVHRCNELTEADAHVPIGFPIGNTTCYVLDQYLQPVPVGVVGELYVGGDGVARGYLGQPGVTAATFLPDPFAGPGARLYRTGDLARYRPDGALEFLGRIDRQLKVRGFRVEPGEVEACLLRSGRVREVAVRAATDRGGDQVLVAYVVTEPAAELAELREYSRTHLPAYMVPQLFVPLPVLPLNPNGKLDGRALSEAAATAAGAAPAVEPRTPTEGRLDAVWRGMLAADGFGVEDDFFALGGDSLLAVRVSARAASLFGVPVPPRLLYEHRTIAALSEVIDRARSDRNSDRHRVDSGLPSPRPVAETVPAGTPTGGDLEESTWTETERRLAALWKEVLGVPAVRRDDNFFALGGHSLKATRIASRVKGVLGVDVSLRLLFQHPTIASFAAAVDEVAAGRAEEPAPVPATPTTRPDTVERGLEDLLDEVEDLSESQVQALLDPGH